MLVHYVDDDEMDAQFLIREARAHNNVELTTSRHLIEKAGVNLPPNLDCVLIDINRPDAHSIEEDVAQVRYQSDSPIIFVTGGIAEDFRSRAQMAGAEAVLDKNSLSISLVQQIAYNARSHMTSTPLRNPLAPVVGHDPALLLDYLDVCLWQQNRAKYDEDIRNSVAALRMISRHDNGAAGGVKLGVRLRAIHEELTALANRRQVSLTLEINPSDFSMMGRGHCAEKGLICLIGGLIRTLNPGTSISCQIGNEGGKPAILLSSTDQLKIALESLFQRRQPFNYYRLGPLLSICTGLVLLNIRESNVDLISSGSLQRIVIH